MIKIRKVPLLTSITLILFCNTAFATEVTETTQVDTNQEVIQQDTEAETEDNIKKGVVNVHILNVRSKPSTESEKLGKLSLGVTVEILAETDGWYEINYESQTAYLFSEYVTLIASTNISVPGNNIVEYANGFIGTPYVAGGNSPYGFDCSGFVQYVMSNFGITMPRTSTEQYSVGVRVDKSQLMPGDLVFFKYSPSSYRLNHVGIYVGDGNFIHSPVPGQSVRISPLSTGYFANYYFGATRVINW